MRCHDRHNLADFDHFDVHFTQNSVENLTSYFSQVRILMQLFDALSFSFTQSFLETLNVQWRQICVTTFQKTFLTSVSKMEECADTYHLTLTLLELKQFLFKFRLGERSGGAGFGPESGQI